ncbi:L-serine ammonia-lyase, iron-sulfur-dependent subunit beta [Hominifimenecus sp. rT4P-3]|uniref:L-serine ammonia-lyase, iron-sulfur-dependent subunit beta n=1 Tax=Hominifimenecus sp. rT4P-3 TaxID=3242979 RepID=UPI003DA423E5
MGVFDIIGPVMVGPSSSHTAGAVRIGYIARLLLGEPVKAAKIDLYGSFLATGKGHGTDRALVAGLLGMKPDDNRIPFSFGLAEEAGVEITFGQANLRDVNPNTARIRMTGEGGQTLEVMGSSLGGGKIRICQVDGIEAHFSGESPTLVIRNQDIPGSVTEVTSLLREKEVNIATMQLYRDCPGGDAVMVLECDQEVPKEVRRHLKSLPEVKRVTYLSLKEGE